MIAGVVIIIIKTMEYILSFLLLFNIMNNRPAIDPKIALLEPDNIKTKPLIKIKSNK